MIATIKDNSITYPTDIYLEYNIYLRKEYKKYSETITNKPYKVRALNIINELHELQIENTITKKDIFSVMDWEEKLKHYYLVLHLAIQFENKPLSIEAFQKKYLRKQKLKQLNNMSTDTTKENTTK